LGHIVDPWQEQHIDWRLLADRSSDYDLVLWTRTGSLDHSADHVDAIKRIKPPLVGFHLDLFWGLKARSDRERWVLELPFFQLTDWLFTADGGHDGMWRRAEVNHRWSPPAVAGKHLVEVGNRRVGFKAQVGFVGSWRNYHPEWAHRKQLVQWLSRNIAGFREWEGGLRGQDLADLYATVPILIGDSCMLGPRYWSDRIPETLGRGGFLLHPEQEGLRDHFPEGTLVTWPLGNFGDLRWLIDYYQDHEGERADIAKAGKAWVAQHHTYEVRLQWVLETIGVG
jgi:hypothetical protein